MTRELALLAARDGVSQNDPHTADDRATFVPPPVKADDRRRTEATGSNGSGPNGAQIYDVYKAAQTPTERRQVLDYLLAMPSTDRARILNEVSKEAVKRSDLPSAIAFTNSLQADLKNRERMLPVTDKFGNRFFTPPHEALVIPEIATPLSKANVRVQDATRPQVDLLAGDGSAPPPPPSAEKGMSGGQRVSMDDTGTVINKPDNLQRTSAELQLTKQVLFDKDSDSSAKLRAAAVLAANGQTRLTTSDGGLYQINVSRDRSADGGQSVSLLYKDNQSAEMQTINGQVGRDGSSAKLTAGADRGIKPGTGNDATRTDANKLFDPALSPEQKLKLADDLAHQGVRRFRGPDGNQYEISTKDYGNQESVVVHMSDGQGHVRPVLRGLVGKDGSVSEQKDSRGNGVGYAGDWAQKNAPENPLLKHQPPEPAQKDPAVPAKPGESHDGQRRPGDGQDDPQKAGTPEQQQKEAKERLVQDAKAKITDEKEHQRFLDNMTAFEKRAQEQHLPPTEVTETYKQLSRLLETKDGKVPEKERVLAAEGFAMHMADPCTMDQGAHKTCNMTALGKREMFRSPSMMAEMMTSTAIDGQWKAQDGTVIKLDDMSLIPGAEERNFPPKNPGDRTFATQLMNVAMINDIWQREMPPKHYVQGVPRGDGKDTGERLLEQDGTSAKRGGRDVNSPFLGANDIEHESERLTGDVGAVISHKDDRGDQRHVGSVEELINVLKQNKDKNNMPLVIGVDCNDPIFGGTGNPNGPVRGHVVLISDYDERSGTVKVLNQWGRQWDRTIDVRDLYRSTLIRNPH